MAINNKSTIPSADKSEKPCVLLFKVDEKKISVSTEIGGSCDQYCGARAIIDNEFFVVDKICVYEDKKSLKKEFDSLYKNKKFDKAVDTLKPILDKCEKYLHINEDFDIRNDLAVTYKNLNKKDECLKTLNKYKDLADSSEAQINEDNSPVEADDLIPRSKKLKFNFNKCKSMK